MCDCRHTHLIDVTAAAIIFSTAPRGYFISFSCFNYSCDTLLRFSLSSLPLTEFTFVQHALLCFQKPTAPLIPNEHTPDDAKPSIAASAERSPSPKEEHPPASKVPPLASPETDAETSLAKDKTH